MAEENNNNPLIKQVNLDDRSSNKDTPKLVNNSRTPFNVVHLQDSNEPLDMQTIAKIQNITGLKQPTPPAPPPNPNIISIKNDKALKQTEE